MHILNIHFRMFMVALQRILSNPFENLLNMIVISLLICMLGATIIINKTNLAWQQTNLTYPQIIVYFKPNIANKDVTTLENSVNNAKIIKNYQFISKEEGLNQIKHDIHLKDIASDTLDSNENPLPDILIINTKTADFKKLEDLNIKISKFNFVDYTDIDKNYAIKINDLLELIHKLSNLITIFFSISLIIIIYNVICLQMLEQKDEITVSRLIGASNSFIMRPLIYHGLIQITVGLSIAIIALNLCIRFINNILNNLNGLFGNGFSLSNLSINNIFIIFAILVIFTIFAVLIAVHTVFKKNYIQ